MGTCQFINHGIKVPPDNHEEKISTVVVLLKLPHPGPVRCTSRPIREPWHYALISLKKLLCTHPPAYIILSNSYILIHVRTLASYR